MILPLAIIALALGVSQAAAAIAGEPSLLHSDLIAQRVTLAPGEQVVIAIRQRIAPGWHTYWRNPGNIGQATTVTWTLPSGWRAGPIQWPTPSVHRMSGMVNFVYSGEIVLPIVLKAPADAPPGSVRLKGVVTSLLCRDVCIPNKEAVSLQVTLAPAAGPQTPDAPAIEKVLDQISGRTRATGLFRVSGEHLLLAIPSIKAAVGATFFPYEGQGVDADGPTQIRSSRDGAAISLTLKDSAAAPSRVEGVLVRGDGGPDVVITGVPGPLPAWASDPVGPRRDAMGPALPGFLLLAFVGGLILNAMPCVFPILASKVAALASNLGDRRAMRREALAYCLGNLAAFVGLGAVLIALRATGQSAGWGFQLQSPMVVAILALVMLASALNLAGLFEAGLTLQRTAGNLHTGGGGLGAFVTGVLASAVAAPCTAPLMAPAIGWAVTQPPVAALAVFAALGLGLGFPFLALSWIPSATKLMPKPGPWLIRLRQFLAFPMLAGAVWLVWIFVVLRGANGLASLSVALLGLAFALWCWGVAQLSVHPRRWIAAAVAGALLLVPGGLFLALAASNSATAEAVAPDEQWSPERVQQLTALGHPVFIDVTAAWCITCKVNEATALNSETVRRALRETGARILKADWTQPDPRIEQFLRAHGRAGVPFYLIVAPDGRETELPQVLSPKIVGDRLSQAVMKT